MQSLKKGLVNRFQHVRNATACSVDKTDDKPKLVKSHDHKDALDVIDSTARSPWRWY